MQLRYFGHSAFMLNVEGASLLFDPFITDNPHTDGVVTADELNPDVILLTHAHSDHWGDTPEIAARTKAQVVANFEIVTYLQEKHGHQNVQPMNTGGSWNFDWGRVKQTYARHSSSFADGTYGGNPNGYILHAEDKCIYNLGDTALFQEMEYIGNQHTIDVALMPIGDCFTMGIEDSIEAARRLTPKLVIPMHWGTFPYIEVDTDAWAAKMKDAGFNARVMQPGESIEI